MIIILNFIIFVLVCTSASQFPSEIKKCHYGDTKCLIETISTIMKNFRNGHRGLHLPQLEPFRITALQFLQGDESPVSVDIKMKDLLLHGFSNINFEKIVGFEQDPRTSKYEVYGTFPILNVIGDYKLKGRVLFLPIHGDGPMNITLRNLKLSFKAKPITMEKDGMTYWKTDKIKILLEPETIFFYFGNLFDGNEELSAGMNQFLNDNSKEIWSEIGNSLGIAVSEVIKAVLNAVITKFSYEEIFLPS